jgi:hypothetical protein
MSRNRRFSKLGGVKRARYALGAAEIIIGHKAIINKSKIPS